MNHLAIDLGSRKSQVCVRAEGGAIVHEGSYRTQDLEAVLCQQEPSHVVLETSAEAFTVARWAEQAGHRLSVIPSTLSSAFGVGHRGVKNDLRDARALSLAACRLDQLPSVHVPSSRASDWRSLNTAREALVSARTSLVNCVRGFIRTLVLEPVRCTPETMPRKVRQALQASPSGLPEYIERLLVTLETLNQQISEMDKQVSELASNDPICSLLMSVPGVGPVTATRFVAALDDPTRFQNASAVTAYLGLTPGENSSGQSKRRTGLTKAGPAPVRRTLVQAAWCHMRLRPNDPMGQWTTAIAERRGNKIAVIALARKLAGTLFAIWRDLKPYDPQHQAKRQAS